MEDRILDGNRLIAEFMGFKPKLPIMRKNYGLYNGEEGFSIQEAAYHTSWDWIMPVLQKVCDSGCIVEISYCLVTTCRICMINKKDAMNIIYDNNDGSTSITPVWEAVVHYLES